jgi:hypothetical protein
MARLAGERRSQAINQLQAASKRVLSDVDSVEANAAPA